MQLSVQTRNIFGKKLSALRKQGLIPAEFYGHGKENLHLNVPAKEFSKIFKEAGESTVIKLNVGGKEINALIYDVKKNPLTDAVLHIDFYGVKMDEKIKIKIPLIFIGEAPAIKEQGGVLIKAMQELEIEALPVDLPHHIEIDLSSLSTIGSSILVKNINISDKVKILVNADTAVVSVIEQAKEEEIVIGPASVEEIKVETEEKKEARDKAKEEKETA